MRYVRPEQVGQAATKQAKIHVESNQIVTSIRDILFLRTFFVCILALLFLKSYGK